jgi:hypothetical protein
MTLRRVNTDYFGWETPPTVPGTPPIYHSARKGEVVDLPDTEIARLANTTITVHYQVPGQPPGTTVSQSEPVLLDPDPAVGKTETRAAAEGRRAELLAELREVENNMPAIPVDYSKALGFEPDEDDEPGVILTPTIGEDLGDVAEAAAAKRRGRPVGSKNAPKTAPVAQSEPVELLTDPGPPQPEGVVLTAPDLVSSDL